MIACDAAQIGTSVVTWPTVRAPKMGASKPAATATGSPSSSPPLVVRPRLREGDAIDNSASDFFSSFSGYSLRVVFPLAVAVLLAF